jgi:ubiquinone/menaquinone biosynthesis C-methylase UbiE
MATAKLAGAKGGTLLDASCGSGLFTRRFVKGGDYSRVVALDFSESMLQQVRPCG